jgi:hypothetical protein
MYRYLLYKNECNDRITTVYEAGPPISYVEEISGASTIK